MVKNLPSSTCILLSTFTSKCVMFYDVFFEFFLIFLGWYTLPLSSLIINSLFIFVTKKELSRYVIYLNGLVYYITLTREGFFYPSVSDFGNSSGLFSHSSALQGRLSSKPHEVDMNIRRI